MDYKPPGDHIADEKFWTLRRVLFTILVLITLISFLAYVLLSNWVFRSSPQPPPAPTLEYQRG